MLSEISQIEKDKYNTISFTYGPKPTTTYGIWNQNQQPQQQKNLIDMENRLVVARSETGGGGLSMKWMKGIKKYTFSVIKCLSH